MRKFKLEIAFFFFKDIIEASFLDGYKEGSTSTINLVSFKVKGKTTGLTKTQKVGLLKAMDSVEEVKELIKSWQK